MKKWSSYIVDYYIKNNSPETFFSFDIDENTFCDVSRQSPEYAKSTKSEILKCYLKAINPFSQIRETINDWEKETDNYRTLNHPGFIFFMPFIVIPFNSGELNTRLTIRAFYDVINEYWSKIGIYDIVESSTLKDFVHPQLWKQLEFWLMDLWGGEYGYYKFEERMDGIGIRRSTHFFDHVIFRKNNLKRLPIWFKANGITPNNYISSEQWHSYLNNNRSFQLLNIPNSVSGKLQDRLSVFSTRILNKISNHYNNWDGVIKEYTEDDIGQYRVTYASLHLCLKFGELNPFTQEQSVKDLYFRLYSNLQLNTNLVFNNDVKIHLETMNWSLKIDNLESEINKNISLNDSVSNWKAEYKWNFPIILVKHFLINDWTQTNIIQNKNAKIVLVLKDESISQFESDFNGKHRIKLDSNTFAFKIDLNNISDELYKFINSNVEIKSKPEIRIDSAISINRGKTFFKRIPPVFSISNSTNADEVYLSQGDNMYMLNVLYHDDLIHYELPADFDFNSNGYLINSSDTDLVKPGHFYFTDFFIGQNIDDELSINVQNEIVENVASYTLPFISRNMLFNNCQDLEQTILIRDAQKIWERNTYNEYYGGTDIVPNGMTLENYDVIQNSFLEYLSSIRSLSISDFNKSYLLFLNYFFKDLSIEQKQEHRSYFLRRLTELGYVEIDYDKRKVYVNNSIAIHTPNKQGCHFNLIGCRSFSQIEELANILQAEGSDMKINYSQDGDDLRHSLFPQKITIRLRNSKLKSRFSRILSSLKDPIFIHDFIVQEAYLRLTEKISDFAQRVNNTQEEHKYDYSGGKYFCIEDVKFKPLVSNEKIGNRLITYILEYSKSTTLLWNNSKRYQVNKNYASFYLLKKANKNVILYDENREYLAIPATIRFPFFIERCLCLNYGQMPSWHFIKNSPLAQRKYNLYKRVTKRVADSIAEKLGQKLINMPINNN